MKKRFILLAALSCFCLVGCSRTNGLHSDITPTGYVTPEIAVTTAPSPTATPIPTATPAPSAEESRLKGYMNFVSNYKLDDYANPEVLDQPMADAEALLASGTATEEDYLMARLNIKKAMESLHDGSGFPAPAMLPAITEYPDAFTFRDGSKVETAADWEARADEILDMYEYYMYGVIRNGSGETLSYTNTDTTATLTVTHGENTGSFTINVSVPDETKVEKPEKGWPVIMALGWFMQTQYANDRGYAVITFDYTKVASDDSTRKGAFYDVYPYGDTWEEQTGALAAWGWGFSKIIDALEQGLGDVYGIDPTSTIATGVSRCGKATAVAGVYDKRIKISVPACSGAGGMAMFRYNSEGNTYDFSSIGASEAYTFGQNEPLSSLISGAERHWFNDNFTKFSSIEKLPFDQHLLASLYAGQDRYLFIISSYIYEDWTNPPAMWETYKEAKKVFSFLGEEDHIVFQIHKEGHAVIDEDVVILLDFADHHLYGKEATTDFSLLDTCIFKEQ